MFGEYIFKLQVTLYLIQDGANRSIICKESGGTISSDPRRTLNLQDIVEDPFGADLDFEDDGMDDDLDPVMKEKLDR